MRRETSWFQRRCVKSFVRFRACSHSLGRCRWCAKSDQSRRKEWDLGVPNERRATISGLVWATLGSAIFSSLPHYCPPMCKKTPLACKALQEKSGRIGIIRMNGNRPQSAPNIKRSLGHHLPGACRQPILAVCQAFGVAEKMNPGILHPWIEIRTP